MATQVHSLPPPRDAGRVAAHASVSLARERVGLRRRLASAVAFLCAHDGPARLGYASQRDYARNALGINAVRFLRLRRVGALCVAHPSLSALPFSVVDRLAERLPAEAAAALAPHLTGCTYKEAASRIDAVVAARSKTTAPTHDPTVDPDYQRVSFTVPASVAAYLDDTLHLAGALLGHDAAESDCVDAVVAEASTEIPATLSAQEARRCFAVPDPSPTPTRSTVTACAVPRRRFRRGAASAALVLDRYLHRLLRRERTLATRLENAILDAYHADAHRAAGCASFAEFGRRQLDMPPSTLHDHLARARLRRRGHPIAQAVATGTLAPAKAQLIERLHRGCHVPASALAPWIELARSHSFRGLFESVRWAQARRDTDYRAWSNAGFLPPTREQIRASKRPVVDIARHPDPEILADAAQTPSASTRWVLRRDTLDVLLQLMAGSRTLAGRDTHAPPWWCLLHVFVTARRQWSVLEREPPGVRGTVLRRDDYRCAVPVCSQRRSLEVHHIRFRSAGGGDHPDNLVTLCAFHHHALHDGRLRIRGRVGESAEDLRYELAIDAGGHARARFHGEEIRR